MVLAIVCENLWLVRPPPVNMHIVYYLRFVSKWLMESDSSELFAISADFPCRRADFAR